MSADSLLLGVCTVCQAVPFMDDTQAQRLVRWQVLQLDRYASQQVALEVELAELRARLVLVESERDTAREVAQKLNQKLMKGRG